MSEVIDATSVQYVWRAVQILDDVGAVVNPTGATVEMAFTTADSAQNADFIAAAWTGNTITVRGVGTAYVAQLLVGPSPGNFEFTAGSTYFVSLRITLGSEIIVVRSPTTIAAT